MKVFPRLRVIQKFDPDQTLAGGYVTLRLAHLCIPGFVPVVLVATRRFSEATCIPRVVDGL